MWDIKKPKENMVVSIANVPEHQKEIKGRVNFFIYKIYKLLLFIHFIISKIINKYTNI